MSDLQQVVKYAKSKGLNKSSRIINVTHIDLDGIVSTINLKNYVDEPYNLFFVQKNYDKINDYVQNVLIEDNCLFKNPDFIIVSDISIDEKLVEYYLKKDCKPYLIVLDHHQTAYHLNKYENCCIDESETKSGADVVLDFIKAMGYKDTKLDTLNKYATQWDLFSFKKLGERKFTIEGKKKAIAEMLNLLYFDQTDTEAFIRRWENGFGKGFNKQEVAIIKNEQRQANEHIATLDDISFEIDKGIILVTSHLYMNYVGEHLMENGAEVVITYNEEKLKFSVRASDESKINVGKILKMLCDVKIVANGGGHVKAGGCNINSSDDMESFLEKFVKLCDYYRNK